MREYPIASIGTDWVEVTPNLHVTHNIDFLCEDLYSTIVDNHMYSLERGTPFRFPSYKAFVGEWKETCEDSALKEGDLYYRLPPLLVRYKGGIIPLQYCRDEEVRDRTLMLPTVFLDVSSEHVVDVFCGAATLQGMGLYKVDRGLNLPTIKVGTPETEARMRRFRRKQKLVSSVTVATSMTHPRTFFVDQIEGMKEVSKAYWASQGVNSGISEDTGRWLETILGTDHTCFHLTLDVQQSTGERGVGVCTRPRQDTLYWDFTRRSIGDNSGNNVLLAAYDLCLENRIDYLNLGVGYYAWKESWTGGYFQPLPGIRFVDGNTALQLFLDNYLSMFGVASSDEGANKERKAEVKHG